MPMIRTVLLTAELLEFAFLNLLTFPRITLDFLRIQLPLCEEANLDHT
jgi:hypothetical protein